MVVAGEHVEQAFQDQRHPLDERRAIPARVDDPPMTSFLAEQLSTAHWFDQRRTRAALEWEPDVGLEEGFERLAAWYRSSPGVAIT